MDSKVFFHCKYLLNILTGRIHLFNALLPKLKSVVETLYFRLMFVSSSKLDVADLCLGSVKKAVEGSKHEYSQLY